MYGRELEQVIWANVGVIPEELNVEERNQLMFIFQSLAYSVFCNLISWIWHYSPQDGIYSIVYSQYGNGEVSWLTHKRYRLRSNRKLEKKGQKEK